MSPKARLHVIADSDDEDDGSYSPPVSPQAQPMAQPHGPARSSDDPSHTTSSTDPVFFQNVYNEQNDAAIEEAHRVQFGAPGENLVDSGGNLVKRNIEMQPKSATDDSIWDIPSSGEVVSQPKSSRVTGISRIGGPPLQPEHETHDAGYVDVRDENHENHSSYDQSGRGKKRRKLGQTDYNASDLDGVDLVQLRSSNEMAGNSHSEEQQTAASTAGPAPPPGSEPSFFIAQRPLTDLEKLSYQSMGPPSSAITEQNQLYPEPTYQLRLASSGSATNINTPRSVRGAESLPLPSTAPWSQDAVLAVREETQQLMHRRRDSSPDIISMEVPDVRRADTHQNHIETVQDREPTQIAPEAVGDSLEAIADLHHDEQATSEEKPSDVVPAATQGKKKRGRPRKGTAPGDDPPTAPNEKTPAKEKKKRGRPKKQSQQQPNETKTSYEPKVSIENDDVKDDKTQGLDDVGRSAEEMKMEQKVASPSHSTRTATEDSPVLKSPVLTTGSDGKYAGQDTPSRARPEEGVSLPSGKQATKMERPTSKVSATGSTPGAKPFFRVGLSKRSKIAPLLKCLRK